MDGRTIFYIGACSRALVKGRCPAGLPETLMFKSTFGDIVTSFLERSHEHRGMLVAVIEAPILSNGIQGRIKK